MITELIDKLKIEYDSATDKDKAMYQRWFKPHKSDLIITIINMIDGLNRR